jgi:glycosyltransferase involved in cell wall biosynthesis
MDTKPPRLLVASEFPPNAAGGGPAVVRQMLKDWPVKRLCWWSCLPDRDRHFGRQVAAHRVARIPPRLYPHLRWCKPKSWLLENVWTPWAAGHFRQTLRELKPDVVWVIPHGWAILPLARVLPESKIGFHVTVQDYADFAYSVSMFGAARCRWLAVLQERLYARATTRDATSHPMVDDLQARSGRPAAQVLHAGLEPDDFARLAESPATLADKIRIAYAGTIHVNDAFELFVTALKSIRNRLPLPVTLEFFGDHSYRTRRWFDAAWMNEQGNLPAEQLTAGLQKCSWGFSPMALTDENPRYNRFSFPTKFISYLAAGLPVITLGHPESSVAKMAAAHEVGVCATTNNSDELGKQLLAALSAPNPKMKYHAGIQRCAALEFDACRMRAILGECFQKCAATTSING